MVEHVDIPDGERHEPKGANAATAGMTYVADGANSGSWIRVQGWSQFSDANRTVGTPTQNVATGVRTLMINDGGDSIITKNPSDLSNPMWDVTNYKHVPIATFDTYHIRQNFSVENYAGATPFLTFELDIGGSLGVIWSETIPLLKGGAEQRIAISFPAFTGATYITNGGKFYLTYTGTGTCDVFKTTVLIIRESKNYV